MTELSVFYDSNHETPKVMLEPYLDHLSPDGVFFEMYSYEGLDADLFSADSVDSFLKSYLSKTPVVFVFPVVNAVLDYVLRNDCEFYAIGVCDNVMLERVNELLNNNSFNGLYSLIAGLAHKPFCESNLLPLFGAKGFNLQV